MKELEIAIFKEQNWALRILDSHGRRGPGVLRHRLTWLGSYEQCLSTRVPPHHPSPNHSAPPSPLDWLPRYCLASIILQQFKDEVTRVGLCLPNGCNSTDVQIYLQQKARAFQGLEELQLTVKSIDHVVCQSRDMEWSSSAVTVVCFCCLLRAVVGFATVYQMTLKVQVSGGKHARNVGSEGASDLANLLRGDCQPSSSSVASEYTMLLSRPITPRRPQPSANLREAWGRARTNFFFQSIVNCFLAGDTFLFISGVLVCYLTLRRMTIHRTKFNILHFYAHRLWRILPVYVTVLILVVFVVPHLGDGPLWSELTVLTDHCSSNWWSNLFFINNWVHTDSMCMEWTWYLALDVQFYLLAPVFIFTLDYFPAMGLFLCAVAVVATSVLTGTLSSYNQLSLNSVHLQQFSSAGYLQHYLMQPYCRAVPYVGGIVTGYFLLRSRCRLSIQPVVKFVIWIIVTASCSFIIFGTMAAADGDQVNQSTTSFYFAISHVIWTLSLAWLVILCCTQDSGVVSSFLTWKAWLPLSRLSLCVYLIHPVVIVVYFLKLRTPFFINSFTMGFTFVGNTVFSFLSALVIYLGVESPTRALKHFVFR